MGGGMGERENDTRGYGSHLPKLFPTPLQLLLALPPCARLL